MGKKENGRLRFVISSILSFLLAILFTMASVIIAVKLGFLSENSVLTGMNKRDYYNSAEKEFYQDAKDYTIPVGLPVEVIDGIVDSETVYHDIKGYVIAAVNNSTYTFVADDLESRLTENIYSYFNSQGIQMSEEQIVTVPKYTRMIKDIYIENMKVSYVTLIGKVNAVVGKYLWIGFAGCVLLSAVIIIMLIKMYYWRHRAVRFVTYSSITSAVLVASPAIIVTVLGRTMKPNIEPEHLYYALINYCAEGLKVFAYLSLSWIAITVVLLFLIRYLKRNSCRRVG